MAGAALLGRCLSLTTLNPMPGSAGLMPRTSACCAGLTTCFMRETALAPCISQPKSPLGSVLTLAARQRKCRSDRQSWRAQSWGSALSSGVSAGISSALAAQNAVLRLVPACDSSEASAALTSAVMARSSWAVRGGRSRRGPCAAGAAVAGRARRARPSWAVRGVRVRRGPCAAGASVVGRARRAQPSWAVRRGRDRRGRCAAGASVVGRARRARPSWAVRRGRVRRGPCAAGASVVGRAPRARPS